MDETKETLQKFASHTKLSQTECDDISKVAQRYLAVHINMVPTQMAYSYVAGDYDLMRLRTHTPALSVYAGDGKDVNLPTFLYAMSHIPDGKSSSSRGGHVFESFREHVFPRFADKEAWQDACRKDQWKEKAAFIALNFKSRPGYYKIVQALFPNDSKVYQRLDTYEPSCSKSDLTRELGTILAQIKIPSNDMVIVSEPAASATALEVKDEGADDEDPVVISKKAIVLSSAAPPLANKWDEFRSRMEPYRKRAGLNATFPVKNVAKQMILALFMPEGASGPDSIMGKYQRELTSLKDGSEVELAHELFDAFHVSADSYDANASPYLVALASSFKKKDWDARTLLKHAVRVEHYLDARACARLAKNMPGGPAKDRVLCEAIELL